MKPHGTKKFNLITNIIAMFLFAAMAMPLVSSAQEEKKGHHHYKLVDIGTLGGPNSFFSGPELPILNNRGAFAIIANTSVPNPNPGCFLGLNPPDCFVEHAAVWHNGTLTDLGVLPGGANSQTTSISASGLIDGFSDGVMTDLGTLSTWPCSTALSVNSIGQVVGETGICGIGGGPAFLSENGGPIVDVNALIVPTSDIEVVSEFDINERGEIAGIGVVPSGDEHAVLLIPCDDAHPNVAGCDYGPVNATTASLLASAPTTRLKMSPSEVKARFRSLMERRYTHFGNLQTSPK